MRYFSLCVFLLLASSLSASAQNLVINGDAEAGPGGDGYTIVPPPDWNLTGDFTSVHWSNGSSWMGPSDPGPPDRGSNYFAGGFTAVSEAVQMIDLSAHAALIDKDLVSYTLSGWLGGWDSQDDNAQVVVWFTDEFGGMTGFDGIGPVFASDRNNITGILYREFMGMVPPDTRNAEITIILTRTDQTYNDGYADNVTLVLDLVQAVSVVLSQALAGAGATKFPLLVELVVYGIIGYPLLSWVAGNADMWGLRGLWVAAVALHLAVAVAYLVWFRFGPWDRKEIT